mmetsp:Transcript_18574/g.25764  ORF Transcript_18574/g.25764 Transcript_18574/m.25764 type:complete len:226 (-) Transcript_18574:250-927(-)
MKINISAFSCCALLVLCSPFLLGTTNAFQFSFVGQQTTSGTDDPRTNNNHPYAGYAKRTPKPLHERTVTQSFDPFVCRETKKTLYDVLGSHPQASREELKHNFYHIAKVTHPDTTTISVNKEGHGYDDFNEIANAWQILSDKEERMRYDRLLKAEAFKEKVCETASDAIENTAKFAAVVVPVVITAVKITAEIIGHAVSAFTNVVRDSMSNQDLGAVVQVTLYDE